MKGYSVPRFGFFQPFQAAVGLATKPIRLPMNPLRNLLLIILMALPLFTYGQSTTDYVGVSLAAASTNALLLTSLDGAGGSLAGHGYHVGIHYQQQIKPRFALESGLYHAQFQYVSIPAFMGFPVPGEDRRHHYLTLLVRPKYYFNTDRVRVYLVSGVSIDVQTYASVNENNNTGVGAQLGAGLEASLGRRLILNLEPNVRLLSLVSFRFNEGYRRHMRSAGVQLGMHYAL